jgi:ATP-dependent Lon protease
VNRIDEGESHFSANVTPVVAAADQKTSEIEALRRAVMQQFDQYVKLNKKIPPRSSPRSPASTIRVAWPTPLPRTCRSSWTTSRSCWTWLR